MSSSRFIYHVYTLCLSYQCYRRIPVEDYYLAPSGGLEHYCCLSYTGWIGDQISISVFHY